MESSDILKFSNAYPLVPGLGMILKQLLEKRLMKYISYISHIEANIYLTVHSINVERSLVCTFTGYDFLRHLDRKTESSCDVHYKDPAHFSHSLHVKCSCHTGCQRSATLT